MKHCARKTTQEKGFYCQQNRMIHLARAQLGMSLNECRELAAKIGGVPSISALSLKQRRKLISVLRARGADVYNPSLSSESPGEVYAARLEYWNRRFPKGRPGFASNRQLAWIQTMWELDFDDGRTDSKKGLRGFIYRQTKGLPGGPVGDLSFVMECHIKAIITPLKQKTPQKFRKKDSL